MNCANHPDRERVAFCQHCGKAICQECVRNVGSSVFCESCLQEKLSGAGQPAGAAPYAGAPQGAPPPLGSNEPNPALAGLLGVIPGVGAMYNGQFAKGIIHLIIFAVLVSLSHDNGIFGLFIAGWVIYQIFEAYHTARARRDGTPLPNPFGLNDIGEKLGFGKAWPTGSAAQPGAPPQNPAPGAAPYAPPAASSYSPYTAPPTGNWAAPSNPASQAWNWENYVPPQPPTQPYAPPPFSPVDPNTAYPRNRFPSGAIWLIALGLIFLVSNSHWAFGLPMRWFLPFLLIAFGVWLFVRRMTEFGAPLADDGTAHYRYRLFHAVRGAVWIVLVGVLFLLDSYHILSWSRSWPLFIIVAGLMAVFRGVAYSGGTPYPTYVPPQAPPHETSGPSWTGEAPSSPPAQPPAQSDHIVPPDTHDEGGN